MTTEIRSARPLSARSVGGVGVGVPQGLPSGGESAEQGERAALLLHRSDRDGVEVGGPQPRQSLEVGQDGVLVADHRHLAGIRRPPRGRAWPGTTAWPSYLHLPWAVTLMALAGCPLPRPLAGCDRRLGEGAGQLRAGVRETLQVGEGWMTRLYWGGGRAWSGLVVGAVLAVGMFIVYVDSDSTPWAVVGAVVVGVAAGVAAGRDHGERWPAGQALDRVERSEVVRLVIRGEGPRDGRLAPAVIEFAQVQRREADSRYRKWVYLVFMAVAAGQAVFEAVDGHPVGAVFPGIVAACLALVNVRRPIRAARRQSRAERAETAARALLATPDVSSATP